MTNLDEGGLNSFPTVYKGKRYQYVSKAYQLYVADLKHAQTLHLTLKLFSKKNFAKMKKEEVHIPISSVRLSHLNLCRYLIFHRS